ncbi:type-F conjugative transfer system pilin assembly protein TrbC [Enterobacter cloacae complex sp. ECC445]|uniref:type-F conjugative transfer system pilin assembly protein TrbC n=1 Tax=Enterobacter cloacae complex sp. ECC445 TaxID=2913213 RepID=UPI001F1C78B7|nr:type-F conjugative transfer system pilin assembly protein TrbC [Enterobacter cloacae complex sp. ECC445]MCG0456767.1 type-F conjugative transfer system pilin assembly protein TrbC [Enterobacter cloacae complex sp. ECC445]
MKNLIVILLSGGLLTATCVRALSLDESLLLPHPLPQERALRPSVSFSRNTTVAGKPFRSAAEGKGCQLLYFLSFSVPRDGLKQMIAQASRLHVPVLVNGLIDNDFHETVRVLFELIRTENAGGVQIDPLLFERYDIRAVPALVVTCEAGYDRLTGNLRIKEALARIAEEGKCRHVARQFLAEIREDK